MPSMWRSEAKNQKVLRNLFSRNYELVSTVYLRSCNSLGENA
jgi:hypothetical protein